MKKLLSYILLLSLISLNNLTFVFASGQNSLQIQKDNTGSLESKILSTQDVILETKKIEEGKLKGIDELFGSGNLNKTGSGRLEKMPSIKQGDIFNGANQYENRTQLILSNTLKNGNTLRYTFNGANLCQYIYGSNITVTNIDSGGFTINAKYIGSDTLYIKYNGNEVHRIYLTISPRDFTATIGSTSIQNGASTYINITDGNGGYSVSSSNTNVATVSGYNTYWTLYAKGVGTTTITVRDGQNYVKTATLTVTARDLKLNTYNLTVDKGSYGYFNITDGNGWYSVNSNNTNIATISGYSTSWTVTGRSPGTTTITVRDGAGKSVNLITKILNSLSVTNFNQSTSRYIGESINFSVSSGNGGYSVGSSNTTVATVSLNYLGNGGTVVAKGAGTATITLKDSAGKSISLILLVKERVSIKNVLYTSNVDLGYIGGMYFETTGNLGEVGIEYGYDFKPTTPKIQTIPLNTDKTDKSYAAFIVPNCNYNCIIYARSYVKESGSSTKIYYNGGEWKQINYSAPQILVSIGQNTGSSVEIGGDLYNKTPGNKESNLNSNGGVELMVLPVLVWGIFAIGVGLTGYTCYKDGIISGSCAISAGLTFIPVGKVTGFAGSFIPKKAVLNYFNQTVLGRLATSIGKVADDLARLGITAKLITKFSIVSNGDDIIKVANSVKIIEKIGNGGAAIMIKGGKEVGNSIKDKFIKDGWSKTSDRIIIGKGNLTTLEKGKEKINIRDFDTSSTIGSYPGYTHQKTIEILKYESENARIYKQKEISSQEIKFILSTN